MIMKFSGLFLMGLLFVVLGLVGCASMESFNVLSGEALTPYSQQYYCCAMGGSIQGAP